VSGTLRSLRSRTVVLPSENIDTDQIIPARFLLTTTREGLGAHAFADWRYDAEGRPRPDFPLNQLPVSEACVLVGGRNFGCGSSREHAVWALTDHGIRAVISTEIADIFRRNALKNGLVPVELDERSHRALLESPGAEVTIDLASLSVTLPDGSSAAFALPPFARYCLMEGVDELAFLRSQEPAIAAYETTAASSIDTRERGV
jgi:3-isopropylmalate/(R)-2-methylmalate dehydratase small subunit